MYLKSVTVRAESFPSDRLFPFTVEAIRNTERIDLSAPVSFLVGDNGSGKSTMLDAIARKSGFLPWGGSKIHRSHGNPHETRLANYLSLEWKPWRPYGFHFRAETFFNFAASLDDILLDDPDRAEYFGGTSLNAVSHGESFLTFFRGYSFGLDGLYLIDEPEAALAPANQVEFVRMILESVKAGNKQYVIATHSPIILGCPGAQILGFGPTGIHEIPYQQTRPYIFYMEFLKNPAKFFHL